jgi:hypothetical protein
LTGSIKLGGLTMMDAIERLMDSPAYDFNEDRVYNNDFKEPQQLDVSDIISTYKEEARFMLLNEDAGLKAKVEASRTEKAKVNLGIKN